MSLKLRVGKMMGHMDHLLGCFIGLKEKYAFVEPMILDENVVKKFGSGNKSRGFVTIRNAMYFGCIQDIVNLLFDNHKTTPSIVKLMEGLNDDSVIDVHRESFSVWNMEIKGIDDPKVIEVLKCREKEEEEERRRQFDKLVESVKAQWQQVQKQSWIDSFRVVRDQYVAHLELKKTGDDYNPIDISSLGLKWGDVGSALAMIEHLVLDLNLVIRAASFSTDSLDGPLEKSKKSFWS